MNDPVFPAAVAFLLGGIVSVLLFVPFVAVQYRREGRLTFGQCILWAGFVVYALALWTYTLLPLPSGDELRCVSPQLQPLRFVSDLFDYPTGSLSAIARNPVVMQVAMNVLLFIPLGFFLRLIWRRGFLTTTLLGLAVSLAIELTQLTGVWGLYPCAYRLFDVDDLIANGSGALVGSLLSLVLRPWLAHRDANDPGPAPHPITFWRRVLGMLCDLMFVVLAAGASGIAVGAWQSLVATDDAFPGPDAASVVAAAVPLALSAIVTLSTGSTPGDLAVMIRWDGGVRPVLLSRLLRFALGIGGWQALTLLDGPYASLFVLATAVAVIAMRSRGGLPGLLSRARPVDSREPVPSF